MKKISWKNDIKISRGEIKLPCPWTMYHSGKELECRIEVTGTNNYVYLYKGDGVRVPRIYHSRVGMVRDYNRMVRIITKGEGLIRGNNG